VEVGERAIVNFYASPAYHSLIADSFFAGRQTRVEDVHVAQHLLRLMVVDGRELVTELPFLDYHEPLATDSEHRVKRGAPFVRWVSQGIVPAREWDPQKCPGREAAPFIDWTRFRTWDEYLTHIRASSKGFLREQERRRRRLEDDFGSLQFQVDDKSDDVFELARIWKSKQLRDTGANDWLSVPANIAFLKLAQERGAMLSSTLRAAGRLLSVWMGFIHLGVWSGWVFAFDHDPRLKKYSVGQQLLRSMLQESHARGHRQFDFSIGGEDYKWMYATHARVLGSIGSPPLRHRATSVFRSYAKRVLARNPALRDVIDGLRKPHAVGVVSAATSPPELAPPASAIMRWRAHASATASAMMMPLLRRAGRAYLGGDTVQDALAIASRLHGDGLSTTVGYWDTAECRSEQVMAVYVGALQELARSGLDTYLSIKPPALAYDRVLVARIAEAAKRWNVRVHCDSHGPETADASHATEDALLHVLLPAQVSTTLPGRWERSLRDADWAMVRGMRVRVVKGQWTDPTAAERDPSAGFLAVIDRLAGRAAKVGIATHDVALAERAVAKLRARNTPFELELLYGLPLAESVRWAKDHDVPVRVYVPFGKGFLPSAVGVLRRNPRLGWLVMKDLLMP